MKPAAHGSGEVGAPGRKAGGRGKTTPGATVRIGALCEIPHVLAALGLEPGTALAGSGFAPTDFDDPDLAISYAAAGGLLAHCVALTGCEHFGLLVGERSGPQVLGLAGFLMMNAADVGGAVRDLSRYLHLHDRGGVASLESHGSMSMLGFTVVDRNAVSTNQIYDMSMAIGCNIMRALCGENWRPTEVLLPRRRPADPAPWVRAYRAPVRFGAGRGAISFPTRWLAHRVGTADPMLRQHLVRQAEGLRVVGAQDFSSEVRRVVSGTMATGKCTAADVARVLGLHGRTLNRRLAAEGTTFLRIHDTVRHAMARHLLRNTATNLDEIAAALGYGEASAFIRAFSRWSGTTPDRWRRGQRQRPSPGAARKVSPVTREPAPG